jgi:class 3 adenylate cyclase
MGDQDSPPDAAAQDGRTPADAPPHPPEPEDGPAEWRLAAVAFLDLVGSTRLMEHDEDATLRRWIALRRGAIEPRVRAWRGRVVGLTGDGLLAEFRSVLDAVAWALDVQAALSPAAAGREPSLRVRNAVHLGDVFEGVDGALYGHAVNIAARLQEHAAPGGVAVSDGVHEQVRHRLACGVEDLGPLRLKNLARPVRAFRLAPAAALRPPAAAPGGGDGDAEAVRSTAPRQSPPVATLRAVLGWAAPAAAGRGWRATRAAARWRGGARRLGLALLRPAGGR